MKKSVLKELFDGKKATEFIKMTDEEKKLFDVVSDLYDKLTARLGHKQLKLLQKFDDARSEAFTEEVRTFYIEGFKLGLLIGVECME